MRKRGFHAVFLGVGEKYLKQVNKPTGKLSDPIHDAVYNGWGVVCSLLSR